MRRFRLAPDTTLRRWEGGHCELWYKPTAATGAARLEVPPTIAQMIAGGTYDEQDRSLRGWIDALIESGWATGCDTVGCDDAGRNMSEDDLLPSNHVIDYPNYHFEVINWAVTGRCNLSCRHCFMAKDLNPTAAEPDLSTCKRLLNQMVECGIPTVRLSGGEPLCHRHFDELVQSIADRGLNLDSIATNGLLLPRHIEPIKQAGLRRLPRLDISFDGLGTHDWMRARVGAEKETLDAISLAKRAGFPIKAQLSLFCGNADSLMVTARRLAGLGVDCLRVNRLGESERWLAGGNGACLSSEQYYRFAERFMREYLDSGIDMQLHFWSYAYVDPARRTCCAKAAPYSPAGFRSDFWTCDSVRRMLAVSFDGEVAPCAQVFGFLAADGMSWGNAYEQGLGRVLSDSEGLHRALTRVRDVWTHAESAKTACAECQWFPQCAGGCRAVAFGLTRDWLAPDPTRCAYFKLGFHERLREMMAERGIRIL